MSTTTIEQDSSITGSDRLELAKFVRTLVSDPQFRRYYRDDPAAAVRASGAVLSPLAADALARNVQAGLALTAHMDVVASVYFYFAYAASFYEDEGDPSPAGSVTA